MFFFQSFLFRLQFNSKHYHLKSACYKMQKKRRKYVTTNKRNRSESNSLKSWSIRYKEMYMNESRIKLTPSSLKTPFKNCLKKRREVKT